MNPRALLTTLLLAVLGVRVLLFGGVEPKVATLSAVALALLGLAALVPVVTGRARIPRDPALLAAALLVAGALLSLPASANRFLTLGRATELIAVAAAYALAAHVTPSRRAARRALAVMLLIALAAITYGLWVTLTGRQQVLWAAKVDYRDSLTGTFINRNHFAAFIALNLYTALGVLAAARARVRLMLLVPIAAALLALGLTLSRGGLLATAAAAPLFVVLLSRPGRRRLALLPLALVAAGLLIAVTNGKRLGSRFETSFSAEGEPSAAARLSLWRSTLRAFRERPLLGHGAGTFRSFYPRYRERGIARQVTFAHQDYLELLAEEGLLGAGLAAVAALLAVMAMRSALAGAASTDQPIVAGLATGAAAVAIHAGVDFPFQIPAVGMSVAVALGLAVALGRRPDAPALGPARSRGLGSVLAILLILSAARAFQAYASARHLAAGDAVFEQPAWDEAAVEYAAAIAIDPLDPTAWNSLARTELNRAKFRIREGKDARHAFAEKALLHFGEAAARDPLVADYKLERAWLFNFLARPEEAARAYDLAVEDDPQNANVLYHAASFRLHRGETAQGIALMSRAVRAWPNFFGTKIPEIHYTVKDPDRVIAIVPEDQPFLVFQYAWFLLDRGDLAASRRAFDVAVARAGWREDWLFPYGGLLARKVSPEAALALYRDLPATSRSPRSELERVRLLDVARRHEEAMTTLAEAALRFPVDAELLRWVAVLYGDAPLTHQALARYRSAGGAEPGFEVARGTLALARGDAGLALAAFERACALAPRDPHARAGLTRAYELLAEAADRDGHCDLARGLEAAAAAAALP